jgi:hypothetical protein
MPCRSLPACPRCARVLLLAAAAAATLPISGARAGEVHDLQRGLPLEVEDTVTAGDHQLQLQAAARYERADGGGDTLTIEPQLQYGITDRFHVEVSYPIIAGGGDRTGSGNVVAAGLYRFLDEDHAGFGGDHIWPSLAVKGQFELPTGVNADGLDTDIRFIATKTLTQAESQDRLHLNVAWIHNAAAESDERHNAFALIFGYSRKLDDKTVFLADLIRQQERQEGEDSTILEAGLLRQVSERVTLAGGVGFGLGDDSPPIRLTVGVQYSF